MVAGAGMKCIKYLMFVFNLLFLIAGLAMVVIGAIAQHYSSKYLGGINNVNSGAVFIIVIGGVIFIVAFFGCCGAIKENRCLLITFAVMMIIILILAVAAVITAYVFRKKTDEWIHDQLIEQLMKFNPDTEDKKKDIIYQFWTNTQRNEKCCGVDNATDWKNNTILNKTRSVPDSCCKEEKDDCGKGYFGHSNASVVFQNGCYDVLKDGYKYSMLIVGGVSIGVALLMVVGIILAFALAHAIHKGYNVV